MVLGLLLLMLAAVGCGVGLNVNEDAEGNTVLDVTLPEAVVGPILQGSAMNNASAANSETMLLDEIDSVDMRPGIIIVTGKRTLLDGTKVDGSFDLALSVRNGQLKALVSNIHIQEMEFTPEVIRQINRQIAADLLKNISHDDQSEITAVNITDTALEFVITIKKK
jgi:hypothetical protein